MTRTIAWTEHMDARLKKLLSGKVTQEQIADLLGVSNGAVQRRIKKLNGGSISKPYEAKPRPDPEPSERTAATVHGAHLENYHRARRGFHVPGHLQNDYFRLLKAGVPIADAAHRLGLSGSGS